MFTPHTLLRQTALLIFPVVLSGMWYRGPRCPTPLVPGLVEEPKGNTSSLLGKVNIFTESPRASEKPHPPPPLFVTPEPSALDKPATSRHSIQAGQFSGLSFLIYFNFFTVPLNIRHFNKILLQKCTVLYLHHHNSWLFKEGFWFFV